MIPRNPSRLERRIVNPLVRTLFWGDRRGGPWPVPDHLAYQAVRFEGNNGSDLAGRWFEIPDARGTVVLGHPNKRYGQHWFVKEGWIDLLQAAGFNALTFDFTIFGQSRGKTVYLPEDVEAAARWARAREPDLPIHLVGVSLGAFHVANASPHLDFIESMVLESPYPTFNDWYGRGPGRWAMQVFDRVFPKTASLIDARANIAQSTARRILVAAAAEDEVTPEPLSRRVADAAPADRGSYLRIPRAHHLEPFRKSARYRAAVLDTLGATVAAVNRTALELQDPWQGSARRVAATPDLTEPDLVVR